MPRTQDASWLQVLETLIRYVFNFVSIVLISSAFLRGKSLVKSVVRQKVLIVYLLWISSSLFWTTSISNTLSEYIRFLVTTSIAVYLAQTTPPETFFSLLKKALFASLFFSILVCIFLPGYGIMEQRSSVGPLWQGIFNHKNSLGYVAALSTSVFFVSLLFIERRSAFFDVLGVILSIFMIFKSGSGTALVSSALIISVGAALRVFQKFPKHFFGFSLFAGLALISVFVFDPKILSILSVVGKDDTFTGRTAIWSGALEAIQSRPLTGFGLRGFFLPSYRESSLPYPGDDLVARLQWPVPNAHNAFLQVLLDLGLVGLLMFSALLIKALRKALRLNFSHDQSQRAQRLWPIVVLSLALIYSVTEIDLYLPASGWVCLVFILSAKFERPRVHAKNL